MMVNITIARTGIVTTKISADFTSIVNATIIAPNTINGLLNNRRKARFRPVCTCNTSLVIRVINVSVPS